MSQGEIRKRLGELMYEAQFNNCTCGSWHDFTVEEMVEKIIQYLASQGVVLKYDKCYGQDADGHNFYRTVEESLVE